MSLANLRNYMCMLLRLTADRSLKLTVRGMPQENLNNIILFPAFYPQYKFPWGKCQAADVSSKDATIFPILKEEFQCTFIVRKTRVHATNGQDSWEPIEQISILEDDSWFAPNISQKSASKGVYTSKVLNGHFVLGPFHLFGWIKTPKNPLPRDLCELVRR